MQSFAEVTTWSPDGPGAWVGTVSPEWMQGRGSFGGIPAAVGLRAIQAACADGRRPRSIHVAFLGPLTNAPARVTAQVLRRGRFVTHARAEILQGGELRTQVIATLGDDRASGLVVEPPLGPERPPPESLAALPHIEGVTPSFVRFLDMRWTDGSMPFSGAEEPGLGGWCRHRTDPGPDPHAALLGLLDAWPSPVVPLLRGPAPASSVSWSTTFYDVPEAISPDDWWWYGSEAIAAGHGYAGMRATLYGRDRRLVSTVEQLVAVFDRPR
ncbi:MAG: thioesterase family protein [Myxococcales bacterium]|nr:thioesterase family protein [Myxococcales bacterium]